MPWVDASHDELIKKYPNLKEFLSFLTTHNEESPRGTILVACSFLDQQLKEIIESYLIEDSDKDALLSGFNAPIGTFSARIKTAHCLGLISDSERDDCETLRKIRNEFAHSHKVSFKDQKIIDLCKNLHGPEKGYDDAYGQFTTCSTGLAFDLINRSQYVSEARLEKKSWPD